MEKLQLILSHFHCCLTVDGGCSLIIYDDLVMIILEYEGCYLQMYDLERTTIRLKKLLEDTKISWQRLNIIGTIERLERKQASFFGFCIPPGTPPNSSSEEITANGNSTYVFFPTVMEKTQNSVLDIRKQESFFGFYTPPGTPPSSSSEEITANGNSTYAFFSTDMEKTQNRVHDIYSPDVFPTVMGKTQNSVIDIRKQESFFGFYTPPGTPPSSSSEEITANGNSTYAFFSTDMEKTQNSVHEIYSPGTPSSQSSFSSDDVTPNGN